MALTLPQLKTLFRKSYPVKAGGPTGVARSKGAIECLDKLAEAVFAAGATVVEATLVAAQALLSATPPTVAAGSLYAITGTQTDDTNPALGTWNNSGVLATVYVQGLSTTAFDVRGALLQADGTIAAVTVDVAAGTYVVEDYATRTEVAAVTGGAPQWLPKTAYPVAALVYNQGNTYRVRVAVPATATTAPGNDLYNATVDPATGHYELAVDLSVLDQSKPFGAYRNDGTGYRGYDTLPAALIAGSTIAQATTVATLSTTDGVDLGGHLYLGYGHRLQIPDGNSISISYRTVIRDAIIGAPAGSANTGFLAVVNDGTVATAYTANQIEASNIQQEIRFFPASGTNPNPGITLVNSQANRITNNIPSRPCKVFLVGTSSVASAGAGVSVETVGGNSGTPATTVVALKATGNGAADVLNTSIPDQTYTRLSFFSSVVRNTGSGTYDASSSRYTAPAAGVYGVSGLINFYPVNNSTATVFALVIYVNGQQRQQLTIAPAPTNSTYYGASGYGEIELALGDYVELWTWHNGGAGSRYVVSSVRSVFTCRFLSA
jgi:hypothetical protein